MPYYPHRPSRRQIGAYIEALRPYDGGGPESTAQAGRERTEQDMPRTGVLDPTMKPAINEGEWDPETGEKVPSNEVDVLSFVQFEEIGQHVRGMFLGGEEVMVASLDEATKGELRGVFCFAVGDDMNGTVYRFLETSQLVALRRYPIGVPVTVEFTGTEKSGSGRKVKRFSIRTPRDYMPQVFAAMAESYKTTPRLAAPQEVLVIEGASD